MYNEEMLELYRSVKREIDATVSTAISIESQSNERNSVIRGVILGEKAILNMILALTMVK